MAYGDNPAQRLLDALTTAKTVANLSPAAGWASVFGLDQSDIPGILSLGVATIELAAETRRQVEALPDDDPELILRSYHGVEATVANFAALTAHQLMTNFLTPYTALAEYSLQMAASLLHRRRRELVVADADLDRLREQCHELIESIIASDDLDAGLKQWIIDLLRKIEHALTTVKITGTAGIEQAADRLVGSLIRHPSRLVRFMSHPAWQGVMALIVAVNTILGSVVEFQQITSDQQQQIVVQFVAPPPGGQAPGGQAPGGPAPGGPAPGGPAAITPGS